MLFLVLLQTKLFALPVCQFSRNANSGRFGLSEVKLFFQFMHQSNLYFVILLCLFILEVG